jgi:hypothetical protein
VNALNASLAPVHKRLQINTQYYSKDDDVVGLQASAGLQTVGVISIGKTTVASATNRNLQCIITKDLFISPRYRKKAVGALFIFSILSLKKPYVFGGVASKLKKSLLSWNRCIRIDQSPIFYFPQSVVGRLKTFFVIVRNCFDNDLDRPYPAKLAAWFRLFNVLPRRANNSLQKLCAEQAVIVIPGLLKEFAKPYQIPHNIPKMIDAAQGGDQSISVEVYREYGTNRNFVVSQYWSEESFGFGKVDALLPRLIVATVTEIYPPPENIQLTQNLMHQALMSARRQGADICKILCQTESMVFAAEKFDGLHLLNNSVFAFLPKSDRKTFSGIDKSENWWCRAVNEKQLEEAAEL